VTSTNRLLNQERVQKSLQERIQEQAQEQIHEQLLNQNTANIINEFASGTNQQTENIEYLCDITRDSFNMLERYTNASTESFTYAGNVIIMTRSAYNKHAIEADAYINTNLSLSNKDNLYYLQDELGSTMYMTGTDGIAFDTYAYDEFGRNLGNNIYENNTWSSKRKSYIKNGNIIQPFVFTGYQYDEISESYFAQARYYDAETGRFTAEDQVRGYINAPDTQNHYLYCLNDPIIFIDLTGLFLEYAMRGQEAHKLLEQYLKKCILKVLKQNIIFVVV